MNIYETFGDRRYAPGGINSEWEYARHIDALIAEHVFHWRRDTVPPDANGDHGGAEILVPPGESLEQLRARGLQLPPRGPIPLGWFTRPVTTDYNNALSLLYSYAPPRYNTRLVLTDTKRWRCDIELHGGDGPVKSAVHADLRMAICLCVLVVHGVGGEN